MFAADAGQLVGYLVKRFVPGHALELRGTARPDAAKGPHEAVGAVRPRAHGQPAVARRGGLVRRHACKLAVTQVQLKRAAAWAVDGAKRRCAGFGGESGAGLRFGLRSGLPRCFSRSAFYGRPGSFASERGIDRLHLAEQPVGYVRDRLHAPIIAGALRAPLHALVIAPLSHSRDPASSHAAPVKAPHRPRRTRVRCAILGNCSTTTDL